MQFSHIVYCRQRRIFSFLIAIFVTCTRASGARGDWNLSAASLRSSNSCSNCLHEAVAVTYAEANKKLPNTTDTKTTVTAMIFATWTAEL